MDNIKTGNLIKELRKAKGMTQKDLADKLNITDRAVSKWERGLCAPDISLLEPLSEILEVKITDLISGEQSVEEEKAVETKVLEVINYSEKELKKKTSVLKRRVAVVSAVVVAMILLWIANLWAPVIFQRGNPLPYLAAAMEIDENNYYVKVDVDNTNAIYISLREGGTKMIAGIIICFIALAVILCSVMCAVVAYNYASMQWGIKYVGYSAPASVAFLYAIPYGIGIYV